MHPVALFASAAFLWPALAAAEAGRLAARLARDMAGVAEPEQGAGSATARIGWTTQNRVILTLPSMRLRDFSADTRGIPALVCAPFALHGATIADFARGHSLVAALLAHGIRRLLVTEWRSATAEMRFFSIDTYLADLNVAVDELGGRVDLIGICQGGWLSLLFAARFPGKVRKLVLAGAPVDLAAADSPISAAARTVPLAVFREMVELGGGCLLGQRMLALWGWHDVGSAAIREILQPCGKGGTSRDRAREARFRAWNMTTVDLPGTYYLQVVQWLFQENRLAKGSFVALGRKIDLARVRHPLFLLAARDDEFVAPAQALAAARLVGTPSADRREALVAGSHLALFMGRETLSTTWPRIAAWLGGAPLPDDGRHHGHMPRRRPPRPALDPDQRQ
jgi:poly(3-hydroxyalkanoate) synthetase